MPRTLGFTFHGVVEENYPLDPNYEFVRPESFGYTGGQEIAARLTLTGDALARFREAGIGGTAVVDVDDGVTMSFPLPFFGDRQEDDIDSGSSPSRITLVRAGVNHALADVAAPLLELDEADPVNGALGAGLGGAAFLTDDDERAIIQGAWVPDSAVITRQILSNEADTQTLTFADDAMVWGRGGDDTLTIRAGQALAWGGQGNDRIVAGNGDDQLFGGFGNDILTGGLGRDLLRGQDGSDLLGGGDGADRLYGGEGYDRLVGGAGADLLDGGAGLDDTADYRNAPAADLAGKGIRVSLASGRGLDSYAHNDRLVGIEHVIGTAFADRLTGSAAANRLTGGDGNDTLAGLAGADKLYGGKGNDVLAGGEDSVQDRLEGGDGRDSFVFRDARTVAGSIVDVSFGNDRIVDFVSGQDTVKIFADHLGFGDLRFEAFTGGSGIAGTKAFLGTDSIFFEGVALGSLTSADFRFYQA